MKSQRLLSITMLLLARESVSAPELARRFEVSARTIYRDIEDLCEAGIPVVAYPGPGGGYGIMGEFKIDRSLFRPEEMGQIASALSSISSALGDARMEGTAVKLKALGARGAAAEARARGARRSGARGVPGAPENYIFVELAPGGRERRKIAELRRGIEERRLTRISYVDSEGRASERRVEPLAFVFTWRAWFLYAYCRSREDYRLFKVARVGGIELLPERFKERGVDLDSRPWDRAWGDESAAPPAVLRFPDPSRLEEFFEPEQVELLPEGGAIVRAAFPEDEWSITYLFGLGLPFEVLEPEGLRRLAAERARELLSRNARS